MKNLIIPKRPEWTSFFIYPKTDTNLKAKARIIDNKIIKVKLMFTAPKGQYYSFINDAIKEAEHLFITK